MMVHSSLRSLGTVDGGAETVVDALLESLGPDGTLVVPTFTAQYKESGFVFDPAGTPCSTGVIAEAARRRPNARRSVHLVASVAAIGPLAGAIVSAGSDSGWGVDQTTREMFTRGGHYLLLGVPYRYLTAGHSLEFEFGKHRKARTLHGRARRPDGSVETIQSHTHGPDPDFPGMPALSYDFNRIGQHLEDIGLVRLGSVGNAIARLFSAKDLHTVTAAMYAADPEVLFLSGGGINWDAEQKDVSAQYSQKVTPLAHGHTWTLPSGPRQGEQICAVDPARIHRPE